MLGDLIGLIMRPGMGNGETPRAKVNNRGARAQGVRLFLGVYLICSIAAASGAAAQDQTSLGLTSTLLTPAPNILDTAQPGKITWMGGLVLRSSDPRFGGLSGLLVSPDGTRITAVSDKGHWVSFALRADENGRLAGVGAGRISPLRGLKGEPLANRWDKDAESLARLPDGSLAVSFEHNHRLWRYESGPSPLSGVPTPFEPPLDLRALGRNTGIEALSEFGKEGLLAIAEGKEDARQSRAFLLRGGRWHDLTYAHEKGFRPTALAPLPDGDILVAERFFNLMEGVKIRLVRVPGETVQPGAHLLGELIATLIPPFPLDNMEGLAVRQAPSGETLIYLLSDDNFNLLQRTLLMVFQLGN